MKLTGYDTNIRSGTTEKVQLIADFLNEYTTIFNMLYDIDGAKNPNRAGVGIVLDNENGVKLKYSLKLSFEAINKIVNTRHCWHE